MKDDYYEWMQEGFNNFPDKKSIVMNDENYLKGLGIIYNFPGGFAEKILNLMGFTFKGEELSYSCFLS
ncbi:hypothetical protein [Peribacillus simplex]|uniref:TIGR03943 family putative permease subunit n=1 Tax=Peribacillus simplex TaxID=1478 RepID=UPI003D294EF8